jgi:RimJ/RimL family protein N-acetyltransferase
MSETLALADALVSLEPMSREHAAALVAIGSGARDTYGLTRVPATAEAAAKYVEDALVDRDRGFSLPFVTRDARSGRIVGSTRFMTIEHWTWPVARAPESASRFADGVEIGSTWLAPEAQRTAINTHAKLLMLRHAFEAWRVRRVTLKTDARNMRSRNAIERIGAKLDGVLRAHMPAFDGGVRDTAFYSIVEKEWPTVAAHLDRLAHR